MTLRFATPDWRTSTEKLYVVSVRRRRQALSQAITDAKPTVPSWVETTFAVCIPPTAFLLSTEKVVPSKVLPSPNSGTQLGGAEPRNDFGRNHLFGGQKK